MRFALILSVLLGAAPALAADIQPNDGQWSGTWEMINHQGCPAQMVQQLAQMGTAERSYSQALTFPAPFDPDVIPGDFTWVRIAENTWEATFSESQPTGMGAVSTNVRQVLEVLSPDRMKQDVTATVTLPAQIAQMAGMSGTSCVWSAVVDHRRGG